MIKRISSPENPIFKKWLKAIQGRGIKKYGITFLSGPKQTVEVLRDFRSLCMGVILSRHHDIPPTLDGSDMAIYQLTSDLFREIDRYGTDHPVLIIRVAPLPSWNEETWPRGCTLFIPFQDPVNVGSVIRSAAAFGVPRAVILEEAAHPFHHKSVRVAGSALFRVPLFRGPSIEQLGRTEVPLITLSPRGRSIAPYRFPETFGLLPGLEGPGLPNGLRDRPAVGIPMAHGVESLNASQATGIVLYLWKHGVAEAAGGYKGGL
jgi:tRNA G18 (ribose-2'-O)-methylase SpoU